MDWQRATREQGPRRQWLRHVGHETIGAPHQRVRSRTVEVGTVSSQRLLTLDGSVGEGGGQVLRTALTLSLLTGRPFRIVKVRANREKPGLRPQHLAAVEAAAGLGNAVVAGAVAGSRDLTFRPGAYTPHDLSIDIGTAGSTALVLQTLHLPLALKADGPVRVSLVGGTFNPKAPAFPFLDLTWKRHLAGLGLRVELAHPSAGFYPRGGGRLDAWIEPGQPQPLPPSATNRGPLERIHGVAGVANLRAEVAERLRARVEARLAERGLSAAITLADWTSIGQGAAISLTAEHAGTVPATFVGIGERGKPAEVVADEAVAELLAFEDGGGAAVDPYSADQLLLPLALAGGRSEYTVSAVTEHLRTNAATIRAFLERSITIHESAADGTPGRVIIGP